MNSPKDYLLIFTIVYVTLFSCSKKKPAPIPRPDPPVPTYTISGKITIDCTGEPLAGAQVSFRNPGKLISTLTDSQGNYTITYSRINNDVVLAGDIIVVSQKYIDPLPFKSYPPPARMVNFNRDTSVSFSVVEVARPLKVVVDIVNKDPIGPNYVLFLVCKKEEYHSQAKRNVCVEYWKDSVETIANPHTIRSQTEVWPITYTVFTGNTSKVYTDSLPIKCTGDNYHRILR